MTSNSNSIDEVVDSFLPSSTPGLGVDRRRVKRLLAEVRAIANPEKYAHRLALAEQIPRNVWVRWCGIEGVESGLPFYEPDDVRKLLRPCLWFAKGGTQLQLEEIIIKEEMNAYENAA